MTTVIRHRRSGVILEWGDMGSCRKIQSAHASAHPSSRIGALGNAALSDSPCQRAHTSSAEQNRKNKQKTGKNNSSVLNGGSVSLRHATCLRDNAPGNLIKGRVFIYARQQCEDFLQVRNVSPGAALKERLRMPGCREQAIYSYS